MDGEAEKEVDEETIKLMRSKGTVCVELFKLPDHIFPLPRKERRKAVLGLMKEAKGESFDPYSLSETAEITWFEELIVVSFFAVMLGGPLVTTCIGIYTIFFGTWTGLLMYCIAVAALAYHPMPRFYKGIIESRFSKAFYKYFSFRMIIEDLSIAQPEGNPAWVGASPPHGVLPIANILAMLSINLIARDFVGGGASVVLNSPFLRYMRFFGGLVDVGKKSITSTLDSGVCVGIVPDGIAGMFKTEKDAEVVYLKGRMGLAKYALRTGKPVVPAYSIGNTEVFDPWFDSFGIMEKMSRKLKASILIFWGRWYLPIPRRRNVTLLCGTPIIVDKVPEDEIKDEQVAKVHQRLLDSIQGIFNRHKDALGDGNKKMVFI
eukprot:CAMPEP_0114522530 /NCGR_PEP_ID=MMETSP0109-20121206/20787_1 /TAXON_ID=29199 /ORGANISM="Chlorarachnion reptans, Strain CCCM449" /LENGTH=375 /DNA_ID=CAMNT_0001703745 /DNA_START=42 /DNA_END=1169 /DNA_ORIENTATION=-